MKKQEITYGKSFPQRVLTLFLKSLLGAFLGAIFVVIIGMMFDSEFLRILSQIIGIILFVGMIYSASWNDGDKDKNLVAFGRIEEDKIRGLKVGLIVMIPYMLTGIFLLLGLCGITKDLSAIYRILNFHLLIILNSLGESATSSWGMFIFGTVYYLIVPAASGIAYFLGYKRIAVLNKIMYGKAPKGDK